MLGLDIVRCSRVRIRLNVFPPYHRTAIAVFDSTEGKSADNLRGRKQRTSSTEEKKERRSRSSSRRRRRNRRPRVVRFLDLEAAVSRDDEKDDDDDYEDEDDIN